jgi:two-component system sensor histidine kinase VicK
MRMQWKIVLIFTLLILFAMQFIGAYFIQNLKSYYIDNFNRSINAQAQLLTIPLTQYLNPEQSRSREDLRLQDIDNLIGNLPTLNDIEVQVVGRDGIVLATSLKDKWIVGQKNNQPEITRALSGFKEESIRIDPGTGNRVKILALPVLEGSQVLGGLLLIASMEEVYHIIEQISRIFYTGTIIALLLTALLGVVLTRTITTPIEAVTKQATAMAEGDFSRKVSVKSEDEIGKLGNAFNHLAKRLDEAITETREEQKKLSSILANMSEGVVATDAEGKIILINPIARKLLLGDDDWAGKSIYQCLRLPEDTEYKDLFKNEGSFLIDIPLKEKRQLTLRVMISLIDLDGEGPKGMIVVLSDVTEQQRIEKERKDFVANVSHELRTPLTTMKSYLESLVDGGALEDPNLSHSFLRVVQNETERMIRLVSDLLLLSRIDSKEATLRRTSAHMEELLSEALSRFTFHMQKQGIEAHLERTGSPKAIWVDRDKMHQVFDNLISNAIKYSPNQGMIQVMVDYSSSDWIEIRISDQGIGIPEEDLGRIFERFYRVDKARSRAMGGTGLGLSIANEIVKLHGGEMNITSKLDHGTTVTIRLPLNGGLTNDA